MDSFEVFGGDVKMRPLTPREVADFGRAIDGDSRAARTGVIALQGPHDPEPQTLVKGQKLRLHMKADGSGFRGKIAEVTPNSEGGLDIVMERIDSAGPSRFRKRRPRRMAGK